MTEATDPMSNSTVNLTDMVMKEREDSSNRFVNMSDEDWLEFLMLKIQENINGNSGESKSMELIPCKSYDQVLDALSKLKIEVRITPKMKPDQAILLISGIGTNLLIAPFKIKS